MCSILTNISWATARNFLVLDTSWLYWALTDKCGIIVLHAVTHIVYFDLAYLFDLPKIYEIYICVADHLLVLSKLS